VGFAVRAFLSYGVVVLAGCALVRPLTPVESPAPVEVAPAPSATGDQLSGRLDGATLRLALRDLAIVLDTLGSLERIRPDLKPQMLRELAAADGPTTAKVVDAWRQRVAQLQAAARTAPAVATNLLPRPAADPARNDDKVVPANHVVRSNEPPRETTAATVALKLPPPKPTSDEVWHMLLEEVRASAGEPAAHRARVQYAALELVRQASQADAATSTVDTELWEDLAGALRICFGLDAPNSDELARLASRLDAAARRLQCELPLAVRRLTICRQIRGYGNVERFETSQFRRGQRVLLYSEVENYATRAQDGLVRSFIRSQIELVSPNGDVAWQHDFGTTEDSCAVPRRDYFLTHRFQIPTSTPAGHYELRLKLRDDLSGREASGALSMIIE
jgi:hypothetical protein